MTLPCCARWPDAHTPDCLTSRTDDADDRLADLLVNVPHQASADLIPWATEVIRARAAWDAYRTERGDAVRTRQVYRR